MWHLLGRGGDLRDLGLGRRCCVLWRRRGAAVAGHEVEDWPQLVEDVVPFSEQTTILKRYPGP